MTNREYINKMIDKEMIIDGIDINKCEYHFKQFDNWYGKNVIMCDCTLGSRCEPKKNCCKFYTRYLEQQLKRKEQECEELKKQLDKYLNQEEEEIRQLNNDNKLDDILSAIEKANDKMEKEIKYKRALDEIEEYLDAQQKFFDGEDYHNLLDIINKAKEQQ